MYRTEFLTLWEKARVGCFERTTSKHVYSLAWNRSPGQAGCMRQVLGPGALGRPRGIGWRGRWEGGSGWGIHVNPWLIHVNVRQKPLQLKKKSNQEKHITFKEVPRYCFKTEITKSQKISKQVILSSKWGEEKTTNFYLYPETHPDAGKDWRQEKRATEDDMVGLHHRLNRHESEQTLGDSEGLGSLACSSP